MNTKQLTASLCIGLCIGLAPSPLCAQSDDNETPKRVMDEGILIGAGTSQVKDTYLSPFTYNGWGARILNERMTLLGGDRAMRQQILSVDLSFTKNPAENVSDFGAFVDYSVTFFYHNHRQSSKAFRFLPGASAHLMGGFIYNTRNGNNPISAKVDVGLSLSAIMLYTIKTKKSPLVLRYQIDVPVAGAFFAPPYGISYYEIFNEGNLSDIIALNSFHNKIAVKNYLTLDVNSGNSTMRLGYLGNLYATNINSLETLVFSNTFMIGWVKRFTVQ
jgi:hypothetical protein